ncbi:Uncharacterised protein [Mycobacterium tuberculosis]|nr:Uncharacterised protein [Mycobacterium tuberculosis]
MRSRNASGGCRPGLLPCAASLKLCRVSEYSASCTGSLRWRQPLSFAKSRYSRFQLRM